MNGTDYLVYTNILIHLLNGDKAITEFLQDKTVFVSFITEMELLSKPGLSNDHMKVISSLINQCVLVDFNHEIKTEAIKMRRAHKLKLPEAIVAASAKYLKLPLMTADGDFRKLEGTEILHITI